MKDSIPAAPGALAGAGHLVPLLRDPLAFLTSLPDHGELVRVRLGPFAVVMICDPELTRQVLLDDRVFDKGGPLYERGREVIGNGLASCPHSAHRRLRRLVQPTFRLERFPGYAEIMAACIDETTRSWRPGAILDVPAEMAAITTRVTAAALFSRALSPAELDQIVDDIATVVGGIYQRMFLVSPLDRLPIPGNRAYRRARTRVLDVIDRLIAQRRSSCVDHGDLLSALIAAHDPEDEGDGMTDAEIRDTASIFTLAGTESTADALSWTLHLLSRHPGIRQRLHDEVDSVLAGAPATYADLSRLEFTGRVITETLRFYPPGWFFTRKVTRDIRLGCHMLPAGTNVAYSPYLIHHRPDLYDDPEAFDPDRWDPDHPAPPRNAHIAFGAGARKCVADTFAITEATLALATIAARWRLDDTAGHRVRPRISAALGPRELRLRITPRRIPLVKGSVP